MNISNYTGVNIPNHLDRAVAKKAYNSCMASMYSYFGNNVDYELMFHQILLCDETREHLYKAPQPVRYIKGTRPFLEAVVDEITVGCKTDREKVLAIMCYIRDLHKEFNGQDLFMGGTEEELIKKREWYCERVSRLMVALCEIAGFAGRIVFHIAAGHLTNEIYFDGKWAYIDPRWGLFYLWKDGSFMSVDEIIRNPKMIYKQNDYVRSFCSDECNFEYRQHRNEHFCLSPLEINCFMPYSLMDADKYHFDWKPYSYSDSNKVPKDDNHTRYIEYGLMTLIP